MTFCANICSYVKVQMHVPLVCEIITAYLIQQMLVEGLVIARYGDFIPLSGYMSLTHDLDLDLDLIYSANHLTEQEPVVNDRIMIIYLLFI